MAQETQLVRSERVTYLTPRDVASVLFQHRKLVLWSFSLILGAIVIFAIFRQPLYRSQMTILVNLERADPVVTTNSNLVQRTLPGITEQEVNSEMELLRTQDLVHEVVIACGLDAAHNKPGLHSFTRWLGGLVGRKPEPQDVRTAKAERKLASDLKIDLIPKSTLIEVSYESSDPKLSAKVLQTLGDLYLKKHLAVRRPAGTLDFFKQQTDLYHEKLEAAERSLDDFTRANHVASVEAERDATLAKLTELEVARHDIAANVEVTNQRLRAIQAQMAAVPARLTTQMRKGTAPPPDQLQSTLLTLELKRTELLGTFQPDYPPVKEVEKQIADAKAAIAASQGWKVVEETTDRDATYEWLRAEQQKATVDLAGFRTQGRATDAMITRFSEKASKLNDLNVQRSDLLRSVKLAEDAYLTYQKKQEEARISNALDQQRILNVAIADKPVVPILSSSLSGSVVFLLGLILAGFAGVSLAFGAEHMNASFRTPQDVQRFLDVPVVVSIPERCDQNLQ